MDSSIKHEFEWLMGDEAAQLLIAAGEEFSNHTNPLKIAKQLRSDTTATRAAMVMEQAQLRIRARTKFPLAEKMFFTKRGLEQSSGSEFGQYKAKWFSCKPSVADVCCGIGGDLIALAQRSADATQALTTVGVDNDPVTALFANQNLEVNLRSPNTSSASVQQQSFSDFNLQEFSAIHLDPDRRKGRRTIDGRHFSPALNDVFANASDGRLLAIKVAPATPHADYMPPQVHREWLGDQRECKQQILWLNSDHTPSGCSATMLASDGKPHTIEVDSQQAAERIVAPKMKQYLYEPRSVVLAAGLQDHLAAKHGLERVAFDIPYYVSADLIKDPLFSRFQVVELLKLDLKLLHSFLTVNDVGQMELKQRGIDKVTYDRVRKLKIKGERKATVILTRYGELQRRRAIIAKRLD